MVCNLVRPPARSAARSSYGIYTVAPEMARILEILPRAAASERSVFLTGETGTGKELFAQAIHSLSSRRARPFRAINCATLSPTLLESELFGHVKGAFTGAIRDKKGAFSLADGGTLFLDEILDIAPDIQGRLLRVLQEKSFVPVGGMRTVMVDVRLISATNKVLREEVVTGRFRDDLGYRVRVIPIHLPPLRERTGDVEALLWHFVEQLNEEGLRHVEAVTRRALEMVRAYEWPGNVRELQSALEYAFVVGRGPVIDIEEFPPEVRGEIPPAASGRAATTQEESLRKGLLAALNRHGWNRGAAASDLGISRATLWRRMREFGLSRRTPTKRSREGGHGVPIAGPRGKRGPR